MSLSRIHTGSLKGIPGEDKAFKSVLINQENLLQVNDLTSELGGILTLTHFPVDKNSVLTILYHRIKFYNIEEERLV